MIRVLALPYWMRTGWTGAPARKAPVLNSSMYSPFVVVDCTATALFHQAVAEHETAQHMWLGACMHLHAAADRHPLVMCPYQVQRCLSCLPWVRIRHAYPSTHTPSALRDWAVLCHHKCPAEHYIHAWKGTTLTPHAHIPANTHTHCPITFAHAQLSSSSSILNSKPKTDARGSPQGRAAWASVRGSARQQPC